MAILFGAVADDDTGATDLAGMLADQGARAVLAIDLPTTTQLAAWAKGCDAVILGIASRAIAPSVAYDRTRQGVRLLKSLNPRIVQMKYCSTFDSTAEGNIGPSIDAALDELGESFTIALPALPVNGRTTYMGHHFVHQNLLSDSSMRHHPLTPMTNSNLVAHLQSQTRRRVGLASYAAVRAGSDSLENCFRELQECGVNIAIVDCVCDDDLAVICQAARHLRLITGSSAPAMALPAIWRSELAWKPASPDSLLPHNRHTGRGILVAAGSCSPATQSQNQTLASDGARVFDLDFIGLDGGKGEPANIVSDAVRELRAGRVCLLRTARSADDVRRAHEWAQHNGLTETEVGVRVASGLADLVRGIVQANLPEGLIIAGGETSGAISRALCLGALRIGANIQPGVPLCFSQGKLSIPVVLKSGNFGGPDFYAHAIAAIRGLRS